VAALISELTDTETIVTLVNLNPASARTVVVQGGAYAEHQIESAEWNARTVRVGAPSFTVKLAPGAGGRLILKMRRYVNRPTVHFPWDK
jgi:hypothetical protein